MFNRRKGLSRDDFEREVLMEVAYCRQMFGERAEAEALARALLKPAGSDRRRVLEEAARHLRAAAGPATAPES